MILQQADELGEREQARSGREKALPELKGEREHDDGRDYKLH
jgi:hypothetical protein